MIDMTPVQSSNLAAVGYDAEARELTIEFVSGETYVYEDIDPALYEGLMSAGSLGSFFYANIRDRPWRRE